MIDDPNAHDPTIGDDDEDGDEYYDQEALYGDPDEDAPATGTGSGVAPREGMVNYRQYVEQAKKADSLDDLFSAAAERVKKPPMPRSDEEKAAMDDAIEQATDDALKAGSAGCPACGSHEVEEDKGMLVCRDCGEHSPNGPRVWSVVDAAGRHATCSELCANVAVRRDDDARKAPPQPWPGDDPGQCFGCGVDILETLTTDGGS